MIQWAVSVLSQKFASYFAPWMLQAFSPAGAKYHSPGRKPWAASRHPAFGAPLPPCGRGAGGEGGRLKPTARAVGYDMAPASWAEFLSELQT